MGHKIRDVITANPVTVDARTPVPEAARVMRDYDLGDVLVIDDEMLRDIVTDRDVTVRGVADHGDVSNLAIGDICSPAPVTVEADDDIDRAVEIMRKQALRRLPVVDKGNVVGIVTLGDLAMEHAPQSALSDISEAPPIADVTLSCQLLFAERQLDALVLDLVALESVDVGGRTLEAGAPMSLALRFDPTYGEVVEPTVDRLEQWADSSGLVEVEFLEMTIDGGSGLVLSKDDEEIVLSTTPGVWERD